MRIRMLAATVCCALVAVAAPLAGQDILAAVQAGRVDTVKALLAADPALVKTTDTFGNNLLRLAILRDDVAMAGLLIGAGLDVNAERADLGGSLLITAASISLDMVKLLVDRGADLERRDPRGQTAVIRAIRARRKPIVDYLLARGATLDLDAAPPVTLLRGALAGGMIDIAKRLMREKAVDYAARDEAGQTLLHFAARSSAVPLVKTLADKGVDPNARDLFGWTPLHLAAHSGQLAMADALIRQGAARDARTASGRTAYNLADAAGHKDVVARLAALQCDTKAQAFPDLRSPYVDPALPSAGPRVFAPDVVSDPNTLEHSPMAFSPDMRALAWSVGGRTEISTVMLMERRNGRWTAPKPLLHAASHPAFSADGRRLFFNAARTLADGSKAGDVDIFYMERTTTGWGPPVNAGPGVNSERDDRSPSLTRSDDLYFEREARLYRSRSAKGTYGEAGALPIEGPAIHPFVSRNESYVLFRGLGNSRAKVAFRRIDGSWSAGVELPETMAPGQALFPSVTPDGKYFFLMAGEVLWADAGFLVQLRERDSGNR